MQLRYVVKFQVREMAKSLLKHRYCPMLLMRTTKTAVCLQNKDHFSSLLGVTGVLAIFPDNTVGVPGTGSSPL